jgi:peptide/nickel transport system permease protein
VLPLLIFIATLVGPSLRASVLVIGLFLWPQTARVVRSQTLSLRSRGFVGIARGFGGGTLYVIRRHLVPALGPVIAANMVFVAGLAVSIEAGLSFLGLGDPAAVSWGAELQRAVTSPLIQTGSLWLWWLVPFGLALTFAIFGCSLIGVALEPRFNPRWRR